MVSCQSPRNCIMIFFTKTTVYADQVEVSSQDRQSCLDCLVVLEISFREEFPTPSLKILLADLEHNV